MSEHVIYWVALGKNGSICHLVSGPFVDEETAQANMDTLTCSTSCYHTLVQQTIIVREGLND